MKTESKCVQEISCHESCLLLKMHKWTKKKTCNTSSSASDLQKVLNLATKLHSSSKAIYEGPETRLKHSKSLEFSLIANVYSFYQLPTPRCHYPASSSLVSKGKMMHCKMGYTMYKSFFSIFFGCMHIKSLCCIMAPPRQGTDISLPLSPPNICSQPMKQSCTI